MKNALSFSDRSLSKAVRSVVRSIPDVLRVMQMIDEALVYPDGLKWFNRLYWMVTQEIQRDCERRKWKSGAWLVQLDVEFAILYFDAIANWLYNPELTPRAWKPLFESRSHDGISPVQFGLAGMNAHINRDLPLAIVFASRKTHSIPSRGTPEEEDFVRINKILDKIEISAMQHMARGWIKRVSHALDPLDRKAAMFVVSRSRDAAWTHAERFWRYDSLKTTEAQDFLRHLDQVAERIGRVLLYLELEKVHGRERRGRDAEE